MRAFSELVLTTTIQTSIDAALAPQKYEETTPYSEAIENVFTTGASKWGDKTASNVADKMFKSAAKQGKVGSKSGHRILWQRGPGGRLRRPEIHQKVLW